MLILCINPRTCFLPTYKTFCSVIARKRQVEVIWSSWLWLMPPPCILPSLPASNSSSDALPFLLPFTFAPTHSYCTPMPEDGKTVWDNAKPWQSSENGIRTTEQWFWLYPPEPIGFYSWSIPQAVFVQGHPTWPPTAYLFVRCQALLPWCALEGSSSALLYIP